MLMTWTVLRARRPTSTTPWEPAGASWWEAGASSPGDARPPSDDGSWWSVVATWDDVASAEVGPVTTDDCTAWHVVLEPVSSHGDVVLAAGALDGLLPGRSVEGGAALITVAGRSPDDGREREFFRRFLHVRRDIGAAPGHVVSLVHAGADSVLTCSVWEDVTAGLDWAYGRSRPHVSAVARQRSHGLVETSGSVRCAVRSSSGTLGDLADPLAGVRGSGVPAVPSLAR